MHLAHDRARILVVLGVLVLVRVRVRVRVGVGVGVGVGVRVRVRLFCSACVSCLPGLPESMGIMDSIAMFMSTPEMGMHLGSVRVTVEVRG